MRPATKNPVRASHTGSSGPLRLARDVATTSRAAGKEDQEAGTSQVEQRSGDGWVSLGTRLERGGPPACQLDPERAEHGHTCNQRSRSTQAVLTLDAANRPPRLARNKWKSTKLPKAPRNMFSRWPP